MREVTTGKAKPNGQDRHPSRYQSKGLSELSKQLRILQLENQAQSVEVDRLERQLRILAELKGISISDLRSALFSACEGEAHADLSLQVRKLEAQLGAASLRAKGKGPDTDAGGSAGSAYGDEGGSREGLDPDGGIVVPSAESFEKDAADRAVADLQLRIGGLEETEEQLREEMKGLYRALAEKNKTETTLQSKLAHNEAQVEELKKSLGDAHEERRNSGEKERVRTNEATAALRAAQKTIEGQASKIAESESNKACLEESLRLAREDAKNAKHNAQETEDAVRVGKEMIDGQSSRIAALEAQIETLRLNKERSESDDATQIAKMEGSIASLKESLRLSRTAAEQEKAMTQDSTDALKAARAENNQKATQIAAMSGKILALQDILKQNQLDLQSERLKVDQADGAVRAAQKDVEDRAFKVSNLEEKIAFMDEALRQVILDADLARDEADLMQERVNKREADARLKAEQAEARNTVVVGNVNDLEQQLRSLYVAFGIVQADHSKDDQRRVELQTSLAFADTAIAKQIESDEKAKANPQTPIAPGNFSDSRDCCTPMAIGTKVLLHGLVDTPQHNGKVGVVISDLETTEDGRGHGKSMQTVYIEDSDATVPAPPANMSPQTSPRPVPRPLTRTESPGAAVTSQVLASGFLLRRESKLTKSWKRRYFVLRGSYGIYQLVWGDEPGGPGKGTVGIATGVSTVTRTRQFAPNQKHAWVLHVNANTPKAPIICAAASCEADINTWMKALQFACRGSNAAAADEVMPINRFAERLQNQEAQFA